MGRRLELQAELAAMEGVEEVYFQPPTEMKFPCIVYERDKSNVQYADNKKYVLRQGYTVTVIDRNPDSLIPDQVEGLPYCELNRTFTSDGLNHNVFQLFY